jgi:hypothetical protein
MTISMKQVHYAHTTLIRIIHLSNFDQNPARFSGLNAKPPITGAQHYGPEESFDGQFFIQRRCIPRALCRMAGMYLDCRVTYHQSRTSCLTWHAAVLSVHVVVLCAVDHGARRRRYMGQSSVWR